MSESLQVASIARRFSQSSSDRVARGPKYLHLSEVVLDAIESGEFKPGSQIPGERNLSAVLPLSLGTIQKAMNDLVDQGVLVRRAGKGTFVSGTRDLIYDRKIEKRDLIHFRFREEPGGPLLPVYLNVESIEEVNRARNGARRPWELFHEGTGSFVRIDRILTVANLFKGFCRFYLPMEHYGSLLGRSHEELSGVTLREFLNKTYNMPTLRFEHQILTDRFPGLACRKLGLDKDAYGTTWQIFGRTYRNAPASYQVVYLPPGHRPIELLERIE
ncbi:MAG: GntR family transcriptional regulator [Hyphomicrobiaceae bacterium]|nr:GntR family transcriptional regulator [Hyphomicrobiaceae bacterium]